MRAALIGGLVFLAACASTQQPVAVLGAADDITALVGRWEGEYSSTVSGRSGSINFTLAAAGDTARGDVVMIPRGWNQPLAPWRDRGAVPGPVPADPRPGPEVLTITFVRVRDGVVSGQLAPYADPETGTRLFTAFEGRVEGDRIAGTYTTRVADSPDTQTGRWSVTRIRPER